MTSAYVQMAWFITLGCEQQSVSFRALLIANQGVIEKLEESRPESRKIDTVTSFGVAQRHLLFRVFLHVKYLVYNILSLTTVFFFVFVFFLTVCKSLLSSDLIQPLTARAFANLHVHLYYSILVQGQLLRSPFT